MADLPAQFSLCCQACSCHSSAGSCQGSRSEEVAGSAEAAKADSGRGAGSFKEWPTGDTVTSTAEGI